MKKTKNVARNEEQMISGFLAKFTLSTFPIILLYFCCQRPPIRSTFHLSLVTSLALIPCSKIRSVLSDGIKEYETCSSCDELAVWMHGRITKVSVLGRVIPDQSTFKKLFPRPVRPFGHELSIIRFHYLLPLQISSLCTIQIRGWR